MAGLSASGIGLIEEFGNRRPELVPIPGRRAVQQRIVTLDQLPEPGPEARHRRQGGEGLQPGEFGAQLLDDGLDQEIAERHPGQTVVAVRDRVEDGGVELILVDRRLVERALSGGSQQRRELSCDVLRQRHLDEDQQVVGHAGVDEGIALLLKPAD